MTTALAAPRNPVADELAREIEQLKPGLYRSTLVVCRIHVGVDGFERAAEVVLQTCADFTVAPPALPPPTEKGNEP